MPNCPAMARLLNTVDDRKLPELINMAESFARQELLLDNLDKRRDAMLLMSPELSAFLSEVSRPRDNYYSVD